MGTLDGSPPVNHGYRIAGVCRTEGWAERADRSLMQISSSCRRPSPGGQDVQACRAYPFDAHAPRHRVLIVKEERPVGDRVRERGHDHGHERGA